MFERELDLVRNAEVTLSEIKSRYDFNISDIFNVIDVVKFNNFNTDTYLIIIQDSYIHE